MSNAKGKLAVGLCLLCTTGTAAPLAGANEVVQRGNLRLLAGAQMRPATLPRQGSAPISVSVEGRITTADQSPPPQLRELVIEINRHGHLDFTGLPTCRIAQIQPASDARALAACRPSLVGEGNYAGTIALPGSASNAIEGHLLLFNGISHGHHVLFGHIFTPQPFSTSFVIVFDISSKRRGTYGTVLSANLAKTLGTKRNLTALRMTLSRRYSYRGARHSYLSSGCPAPKGINLVPFSLARTTFGFAGKVKLSTTLSETCRARG